MIDKISATNKSLSPAIIRQNGNHLKNEKSAYLQQHAHNPVDWYPWGGEAISRARAEDKPIFLSIGYASCHWCHVMEAEIFAKDEIASFLNENYINIKVDREERPDLDAVYMEAVQAITGGGGWPLTVFLTPDLAPFYGGTYLPYEQFKLLTTQISDIFRKGRARIYEIAAELKQVLSQSPPTGKSDGLKWDTIKAVAENSLALYNETWGGFTGRMKFPTPVRWQFLLHYYRKTGDLEIANMIRHTLNMIGSGGLHDHIGGGFHRYATEPSWLIPHFEKMLYDNAQLASLYLEASVVFADSRYADIARSTLDYLIRDMSGEEGAFYASYDADSEGQEGLFYLWTEDEILAVADENDGPALALLLGVTTEGNFEGKNIITRRADSGKLASHMGMSAADIEKLFDKYQSRLRNHRSKRTPPNLDKKIIASWNGLAIAALAQAYGVWGDDKYRSAAEKAVAYIWRVHYRQDGGLYRSSYEGEAANEAVLDDYAFLVYGLIELYQSTGAIDYLKKAILLIDYARDNFGNLESGYYLTKKNAEAPLGRKIELFDSVEPSGMAMILQVILRLATITGDKTLYDQINSHLGNHARVIEQAGLEMAWWLDAGLKDLGPFYEAVIIDGAKPGGTANLVSSYWQLLPSHAVLVRLSNADPGPEIAELIPSIAGKTSINRLPTAYICHHGTCQLPVTDPVQLKKQLMAGWAG